MIKKIIIIVEEPLYKQAIKAKGDMTWVEWLDKTTKEKKC